MTLESKEKIIAKISRQWTLDEDLRDDNTAYDEMVAMKNDGIPNLREEDWYVNYTTTLARDVVQQSVNIYSTERPKWNVLPRGLGDIDKAEEFERTIEWYFYKAAQKGRVQFHSDTLLKACKYNSAAAQLQWEDEDDFEKGFCIYNYHRNTVVYEYGSRLLWLGVVTNIPATAIIEKYSGYAEKNWWDKLTKGDEIGSALRKVQKLLDDDEEQRVMYVDYTSDGTRYCFCWPVADDKIDDSFGHTDEGTPLDGLIEIQYKENKLGFVNWAVAEGVGDALLAPLHKAGLYKNINDTETLKRTNAFRRAFFPMFMQHGREDADADVSFDGSETVIKAPTGAQLTQTTPPPLDPAFNELSAQDVNNATNAVGIGPTAALQISNVQHSTLQEQIKLRLAQLEPYKRVSEQLFVQLAILMFKWAKKKGKSLKARRMYSRGEDKKRGSEVMIEVDDINLDELHIECKILPNNENDKLQITNQIQMLKASGIAIPDDEFIEMLYMGSPEYLRERWYKQEIENTALEAMKAEMMAEVQNKMQMQMATFQAQLEQQMQQAQMQMQQPSMQPEPGMVAPEQGMGLGSDMSGQGFAANMGGTPPQVASPGITQAGR